MKLLKRLAAAAAAAMIALCTCTAAFADSSTANDQDTITENYDKTVATPKANVKPGEYESTKYISLSCSTPGARIFYTTDGSYPTVHSTEYKKPIRIKGIAGETVYTEIRAVAIKTGYNDSDLFEGEYLITMPAPKEVIYMELYKAPTKTEYKKGEEFDVTGGILLVTYKDHTFGKVSMTTKMISGFNTNTAGQKTITVTYKGFTDEFIITVRPSKNPTVENDPIDPEDIFKDDKIDVDTLPQISGKSYQGWSEIKDYFAEKKNGSGVTILLNGATNVPASVIRAAAKKDLVLTLILADDMSWRLNTKKIDTSTITQAGYGIRTGAIYIPKPHIKDIGGEIVHTMHFNSDNKFSASFTFVTEKTYSGSFASLFKYDSATRTATLVDCVRVNSTGKAVFTPKTSGDHFIVIDNESKIKGDFDNNLVLNGHDFNALQKMIMMGEDSLYKADINADGTVDSRDIAELYRRIY